MGRMNMTTQELMVPADKRGEECCFVFFWLNSMFLTRAPCGDKGQEKVFVLKLRVINENPFHPAADRLQEKRLTKFCV